MNIFVAQLISPPRIGEHEYTAREASPAGSTMHFSN
jgi:hypothetical protein